MIYQITIKNRFNDDVKQFEFNTTVDPELTWNKFIHECQLQDTVNNTYGRDWLVKEIDYEPPKVDAPSVEGIEDEALLEEE